MTRLRRAAALLIAGALFALFAGACSEEPPEGIQEKTSGDSIAVSVNSKAPAFAAKLLGGGTLRLSEVIGNHVVLLEFWSVFCKSCIQEMPRIHELHEKYAAEGLTVLSINTDFFSDDRISSTLKKAGVSLKYPILRDRRQEIAKAFNVELLPVTVIIDREGWIRLYQEGYKPGDEDGFESIIQDLLDTRPGKDVTLAPRDGVTAFVPAGRKLVEEGQEEAPVGLRTLKGKPMLLGHGKPSLLFFWSLYCQPCREEFPEIEKLRDRYADAGINIATVNVDTHFLAERVQHFLQQYPALDCLPDWGGEKGEGGVSLAGHYGVSATPTVILLDAKGKVAYAAEGMADLPALESQISKLIPGK